MVKVAVASGKGGTGKTLLSTSLAVMWSRQGHVVTYVDADVEAPNGHLFLKPRGTRKRPFTVSVPSLEGGKCAGHGECQKACAFNAILAVKKEIIVFHELCHSCGACLLACPDHALREAERPIGAITRGRLADLVFFSGTLAVGEARATPLVRGVIDAVDTDDGIVVIDAPPGTSCSAMAAADGADLLLLVTEPTPFGLHDLALAVGMGRALGKPIAAVINRADLGDRRTARYLETEGIPVLSEIPFDRAVAESYAASRMPLDDCEPLKEKVSDVAGKLLAMSGGNP